MSIRELLYLRKGGGGGFIGRDGRKRDVKISFWRLTV